MDSNVVQCQLCPNLYGRSSKTDLEPMVLLDVKFKSLAVSTIFFFGTEWWNLDGLCFKNFSFNLNWWNIL